MSRFASLAAALALVLSVPVLAAPPLVIAHRGRGVDQATNPYPENTLPAFEAGLDEGADILELDVQLDRDGLAILWHDADVELQGRRLRIEEVSHRELPVRRGPTGIEARVPTLLEVVQLAKRRMPAGPQDPKPLDIELKVHRPDEGPPLVAEVARLLRHEAMVDRVILKSFDEATVVALEEALPGVETGFLARTPHEVWTVVERRNRTGPGRIEWAMPGRGFDPTRLTHKGLVSLAHADGLRVAVWTVNPRWQMWMLLAAGVDGIITDRPALARALVGPR